MQKTPNLSQLYYPRSLTHKTSLCTLSCDTGPWSHLFAESLLKLPSCFHWRIFKFMATFEAIPLHKSFRHFAAIDNPVGVGYTHLFPGWLPATGGLCRGDNMKTSTVTSPTSHYLSLIYLSLLYLSISIVFKLFSLEKLKSILFEQISQALFSQTMLLINKRSRICHARSRARTHTHTNWKITGDRQVGKYMDRQTDMDS